MSPRAVGILGARARWAGHDAPEARVRLARLTPDQRTIVRAMLGAASAVNETAGIDSEIQTPAVATEQALDAQP